MVSGSGNLGALAVDGDKSRDLDRCAAAMPNDALEVWLYVDLGAKYWVHEVLIITPSQGKCSACSWKLTDGTN